MKKQFLSFAKLFLLLNILFIVLIGVNLIPKEFVKNNIEKSLSTFSENDGRYNIIENIEESKNDTIADSVILNIMYNSYNKSPIKDTLTSKYYLKNNTSYPKSLVESVKNDTEKNVEYSRYWHGYLILFKPLFTILTISQVKIFYFVVLLLLSLFLFYLCYKNNMKEFGFIYIISTLLCNYFMSCFSLEYIPAVLLSIISCIIIIKFDKPNYYMLFALFGMLVSFFDFLTVETVTLTLPLLCLVVKFYKEQKYIKIKDFVLYCVSWAASYGLTFFYKWVLTSVVTGENYISIALNAGAKRIEYSTSLISGLKLNVQMLFPWITKASTAWSLFLTNNFD